MRPLLILSCALASQACAHVPAAKTYAYSCVVDPNDDAHPSCLRSERDGAYSMNPALLHTLAPPGKKLFSLRTSIGFFWVRADGFARPTPVFDNWADYFCDGLTRTREGEQVGFMNTDLEIIVPPTYDFVSPFQGGRAAVCHDCKSEQSGEYTSISCSKCRVVDTRGQILTQHDEHLGSLWPQLPERRDDECSEP